MDEDLDDDFELGTSEEPDPLDAENFNPVDYVNKVFPNEESLGGLEAFIGKLKAQQQHIDEDIRHAVRRQAACGRRARADLDEAKQAVRELFERIKGIKSKAEQSEALVSDVCRDIRSLDTAKRNLTLTVTALKRLVMLVTALEQLRTFAGARQYQDASRLIHAVEELAGHFQELSHVARVADLLERKAWILGDLRAQLLDDYKTLHGDEMSRPPGIEDAAFCVDAMGASVRRDVITQFCLRLLEDYKDIFQPPKEASGLDMVERRYSWLTRTLRAYNEKYASHFPESWRVPCGLCEHFCHVTRQHLVEVLSTSHHVVDPELMVRVLRKSIDFENDLARKYPVEEAAAAEGTVSPNPGGAGGPGLDFRYPDVLSGGAPPGRQGAEDPAEFAPRFRGIISECFDAYLITWVQHEEKQLLEVMEQATKQGTDTIQGQEDDQEEEDEDEVDPRCLFSSAPKIFSSMKASMTKCSGFSTHQTLFEVFQVFRKIMTLYAERLDGQLASRVGLSLEIIAVQAVCSVLGTAEYCLEMLPRLAGALKGIIDADFQDRVNFEEEEERLRVVINRSHQVLVDSVDRGLDDSFKKMTQVGWATYEKDASEHNVYVDEISDRLCEQFLPIAKYLKKTQYRFFCVRFAQAFAARLVKEIFRCRKINERGAQQLLHHAGLMKTTLLEAPIQAVKGGKMAALGAYQKCVVREIGKAEGILKVLTLPDADTQSAITLLGGSFAEEPAEVEKILALRASSDADPGPLPNSPRDDDRFDNSGLAAVKGFGSKMMSFGDTFNSAKTSEDLKKLSGDMRKKLMNLPGISGKKG